MAHTYGIEIGSHMPEDRAASSPTLVTGAKAEREVQPRPKGSSASDVHAFLQIRGKFTMSSGQI